MNHFSKKQLSATCLKLLTYIGENKACSTTDLVNLKIVKRRWLHYVLNYLSSTNLIARNSIYNIPGEFTLPADIRITTKGREVLNNNGRLTSEVKNEK